ncbi:hypothetical protein BN946_scf184638.g4 [Trametes cinnabarina]|uniref:Retrotransposon gag domain-containing protein n=1 Tax=Pycnoporus cinnabarinus TaxID=5643 RepID=A0A060SZV4_PYCCI|nr:hypothetical protein BN946_scf184638.g4 [Trametes cinnabarina]
MSPQPAVPAPEPRDLPPYLPNPNPAPTSDPQRDLAQAMLLLTQMLWLTQATSAALFGTPSTSSECQNIREPDQFDGSDPTKLCLFFMQLELVLKACPRMFNTDKKKVTYVIFHLKGMALAWFEPYLLEHESSNPPEFLHSYVVFQEELRVNFDPYDIMGQAEHDLKNLRMVDNQQIAKYITQFNRLAMQVRWGCATLHYQFYKGLPARLKDQISKVRKLDTLEELCNLAQSLDHGYWECMAEQAQESSEGSKSSSRTSGKSALESKSSSSSWPSQSSESTPFTSSSATPWTSSGTLKTPSKQASKPYTDKLGKDSKLTQKEHQHRFANNLCLFCRGPGHVSAAWSKKTNTPAKGCAAQGSTTSKSPLDIQPESETKEEPKKLVSSPLLTVMGESCVDPLSMD